MLVWLASYPRSGNTLLRMILKCCFGVPSYSIYQRPEYFAHQVEDPNSAHVLMGAKQFPDASRDLFEKRARREQDLFLVQTHDPTPPADRAIYVVRDGRAAIASYHRFLATQGKARSVPALIAGDWVGPWGDHVDTWLDRPVGETLLLRFEDLINAAGPPLDRIAAFIGQTPTCRFDISFARLNSRNPSFFGVGSNGPGIEFIEREYSETFWNLNGTAMRRLGYMRLSAEQPPEGVKR